MVQRVAVIGFVIALIIAVLAFTQQQAALDEARSALAARDEAEADRVTAVAMMQDAAATQVSALSGQATAQAAAEAQSAAAATAEAARATAETDAAVAAERAEAVQATATAGAEALATAAAASEEEQANAAAAMADQLAELGAQAEAASTAQAAAQAALATVTAELDRAVFARESAEADRAAALEQAWAAATEMAAQQAQVATAQAIVSGVTATPLPPTPAPAVATLPPTEAPALRPALTSEFVSRDDGLRFAMPEGWVSAELDNGIILVGTSNSVFERSGSVLSAGMFEIDFIRLPLDNLGTLSPDSTVEDVMTQVIELSTSGDSGPTDLGDIRQFTIAGMEAARVEGSEGGNTLVLTVLKPEDGKTILLAFAYAVPGEMPDFLPILDDMLASLQLNAT